MLASENGKPNYCNFFLQYCYNTILKLELYYSSILKKIIFYSLFSTKFLSPLSHYFSSLLSFPSMFLHQLSPLFRPKHHSPPNINITHHNGSFFLVGYNPTGSVVGFFFFFLLWPVLKGRGGYGWSGLWVVVGSSVWVMVGLWLKWVVGHWRSLVFGFGEVMVRSAWVMVMGLVEIGVGHCMVGWFFWVLPFQWFFFF